MKQLLLTLLLLFSSHVLKAQIDHQEIFSEKLGENRQLKIQLPRSYNSDTEKTYPLIIVFDGDFLFEPVAGNVDYYSYWEDMPESIVVGINQVDKQDDDCYVSEENFLPVGSGADFFEFIGMELIPYIQKNYRAANFFVAVGYSATANFINYYILKAKPLFQAYVSISPYLTPQMENYVAGRLQELETETFYYLATSTNDLKNHREGSEVLNMNVSNLTNENIHYKFDDFEGATHYSLVAHAIPNAIEHIFSVYQPISKEEFSEVILKLEYSPVDYLKEKYESINNLFNLDKKILINDFKAIAASIEKRELFEYYQELSKLARDHYPDSVLSSFYLARFYEETGEPKKAYKTYKAGYAFDEIAGITKDLMLEKAEELKMDFGY